MVQKRRKKNTHTHKKKKLQKQTETRTEILTETNFIALSKCMSYLASAETVRDLLLPAETTVHEKWLPAETVRVILLPTETLDRTLNHTDSLCSNLFTKHNSLGRGQSRRKPNIRDSLRRKRKLADSFIPC